MRNRNINMPGLEENPLLLFTLAYCELIDFVADTLFPPNSYVVGNGKSLPTVASLARPNRYIHCRAAWQPDFGKGIQLALRDLSATSWAVHGKPFVQLDISQRTEMISSLKDGLFPPAAWTTTRSQKDAFLTIHDAIAAGVFADPGYGGNYDGVGWRYAQFIL